MSNGAMLDVESLAIPDVKLIRPRRFDDARGFFSETFKTSQFAAVGLPTRFVQDNCSYSPMPASFAVCTFSRRRPRKAS